MQTNFDRMLRQRISNLIGYILQLEPMQNPTNQLPPTKDLTFQSILSILAEKVEDQFLQYWQINQTVSLVISIVVSLVFKLMVLKWFKGSRLINTCFNIVYAPINWLSKSRRQYPLPVMNVPTYTCSRFTEDKDFNALVKSFVRYAIRLQDKTGALLTLIEDKCLDKLEQRILNRKPNATFNEIKEVLKKLYGRETRYNDPLVEFASRKQRPNENIYNYLCELERLAGTAYPEQDEPVLEPLIVDRFIRGIHDMKIKQELCRPPMCNNLSQVLTKAYELEEAFSKCENPTPPSILSERNNQVSNNHVRFEDQTQTRDDPSLAWCTRCTHHRHLIKDCFRTANNSRTQQNFETQVRAVNKHNRWGKSNKNRKNMVHVEDIRNVASEPTPIDPIQQPLTSVSIDAEEAILEKKGGFEQTSTNNEEMLDDSIEGTCLINELPITFTIDTGAQITVISENVYNALSNPSPLEKVPNLISGAGGAGLEVLGKTYAQLRIGEAAIFTFLVVIKDLVSDCLLGMDLLLQFPYFKQPLNQLKDAVKQLSKDLVTEPKQYLRSAISNSSLINTLTDLDVNHYLEKINELLKGISASSLKELKPSQCFEHEIKLTDPSLPPIKQKMRRIPYSKREEFKTMLDEMLEANLIRPSDSPWASPLMLVSKPDGSIRVTIDYRLLNGRTMKDAHPLPNSEDLYASLAKSSWYTKLDLYTGYFQILMRQECSKLTAFTCEWGLFEYVVMPMGLTNAPATFQRAMNQVLRKFIESGFVVVYLDDILIHSESLIEHLKHIELVVNELKKYQLSVKLKKCEVAKQEITFLGHVISNGSIKPDQSKCEALYKYKRPQTLTQLQSFLGLAQYYRKFIENFAKIAAPLYRLTTKEEAANKKELNWDEACEIAYTTLRNYLTRDKILMLPDLKKKFVLETDVSNTGVGAVLSQEKDGVLRPIAYYSKPLNKAQRNYSTTEKELLAIVLAIEHFHQYLYGQLFDVVTDHQPLSWLMSCKTPNSRLARWLIRINNYNFRIVYRSGKIHTNADALSRWNLPEDEDKSDDDQEETSQIINFIADQIKTEPVEQSTASVLVTPEEQDKDPCITWMKQLINKFGETKPILEKEHLDTHFKRVLYENYDELRIIDNVLHWYKPQDDGSSLKLIMLPEHMVNNILSFIHCSVFHGHLGVRKTLDKIRTRFYRPALKNRTITFIKTCLICQKIKNPQTMHKAKLQPLLPTRPFQVVTVDIIGPLPLSKGGNMYILVVCDHFSKWVALFALHNTTADKVAKRLISLMMIHGLFINILTDGAKNFQSELLAKVYELLDIFKLKTSPYHPECDGLTERFNRTLKTMLACFVNEHQNDWDEYLQYLAFAYNTSTHATTNYTPYEVVYGRKPKIPLDLIIENEEDTSDEIQELNEFGQESLVVKLFVEDLQEKLREVYTNVEKNRDYNVEK